MLNALMSLTANCDQQWQAAVNFYIFFYSGNCERTVKNPRLDFKSPVFRSVNPTVNREIKLLSLNPSENKRKHTDRIYILNCGMEPFFNSMDHAIMKTYWIFPRSPNLSKTLLLV